MNHNITDSIYKVRINFDVAEAKLNVSTNSAQNDYISTPANHNIIKPFYKVETNLDVAKAKLNIYG